MAEQHQHNHHHHHHKKDSASIFKEKSLRAIEVNKLIEKWLKIAVTIVAIIMVLAVIVVYVFNL